MIERDKVLNNNRKGIKADSGRQTNRDKIYPLEIEVSR